MFPPQRKASGASPIWSTGRPSPDVSLMDCPIQEPEVLCFISPHLLSAMANSVFVLRLVPPAPAERWLPPSITGKQAREVLVWLLCKLEGGYLWVSGRTSLFTVKQCKKRLSLFCQTPPAGHFCVTQAMKPASWKSHVPWQVLSLVSNL